jgi:protein phosphatase
MASPESNKFPASTYGDESGIRSTLVPRAPGGISGVVHAYGATDVGRARARNDDSFVIARLDRLLSMEICSYRQASAAPMRSAQGVLLAVADGMGGYDGGGLASSLALDTICRVLMTEMAWMREPPRAEGRTVQRSLTDAVRAADEQIRATGARLSLDPHMGTTLTAAYVAHPWLYVAHVGDSRAYLLRSGDFTQLTSDHTMAEELLHQNVLSAEQAARSHLRHVLVNAVGGIRDRELEVETRQIRILPGDRLLLCSDGLSNHVSDEALAKALRSSPTPQHCCERLIAAALEGGGSDNVTAVVAGL